MDNTKTTIYDIAKALKIDSSTVSRALNNSTRVSQKTKDKILTKARELGYQRNLMASNLRRSRSNTLGVIVPRISRHFFSSAIAGIEETAYNAGYSVVICQSLDQLSREQNMVETLLANRVDGILISISMETVDQGHFQNLKKKGTHFLFFDRHCDMKGISKVLIDDFQAGFDATEHLILKGCKTIAHFSGPQHLEIYKNRYLGYRKALKKHKIPYRANLILYSRLMGSDGTENAKTLLSLPVKVDGIFAANDVSAISAMQYLKKKGVVIPRDLAIVGFSNEPTSAVMEPSLTTMDQSGFQMGKTATELLLQEIGNGNLPVKAKTTILRSTLIERDSSNR